MSSLNVYETRAISKTNQEYQSRQTIPRGGSQRITNVYETDALWYQIPSRVMSAKLAFVNRASASGLTRRLSPRLPPEIPMASKS